MYVELCFNNYQDNIQIRVSGSVERVEDLELKKEIVAKREFLKPWVEQMGYACSVSPKKWKSNHPDF